MAAPQLSGTILILERLLETTQGNENIFAFDSASVFEMQFTDFKTWQFFHKSRWEKIIENVSQVGGIYVP